MALVRARGSIGALIQLPCVGRLILQDPAEANVSLILPRRCGVFIKDNRFFGGAIPIRKSVKTGQDVEKTTPARNFFKLLLLNHYHLA